MPRKGKKSVAAKKRRADRMCPAVSSDDHETCQKNPNDPKCDHWLCNDPIDHWLTRGPIDHGEPHGTIFHGDTHKQTISEALEASVETFVKDLNDTIVETMITKLKRISDTKYDQTSAETSDPKCDQTFAETSDPKCDQPSAETFAKTSDPKCDQPSAETFAKTSDPKCDQPSAQNSPFLQTSLNFVSNSVRDAGDTDVNEPNDPTTDDIPKGYVSTSEFSESGHIISGSFHQGNVLFEDNAGKQCVANSVTAILMSRLKDVFSWQTDDLDAILLHGNELYTVLKDSGCIRDPSGYIAVNELPDTYTLCTQRFSIKYAESVAGLIGVSHYDPDLGDMLMPLDKAIRQVTSTYHACLLTINENTCVILLYNGWYVIVDSHSRSRQGMSIADGTSIVAYYQTFTELYTHVCKLAESLRAHYTQFEVTGVQIKCDTEVLPCDVKGMETTERSKVRNCDGHVIAEELLEVPCDTNAEMNQVMSTDPLVEDLTTDNDAILSDTCEVHNTNEADNVVILKSTNPSFTFHPVKVTTQKKICSQLQVPFENNHRLSRCKGFAPMGEPCETKAIRGDGNCFFRAMSFVICGTEERHLKIRRQVVNHLLANSSILTSYLRDTSMTMETYVRTSRMKYSGSWATEIEILACAHMMKTDIYTFNENRWNVYNACCTRQNTHEGCKESIYLQNLHSNHYEVVTCVKHRDNAKCCANQCDYGIIRTGQMLQKGKLKREREKYTTDELFRCEKKHCAINKYQNDEDFRYKKIENTKLLYEQDETYKAALKQRSQHNYASNYDFQQSARGYSKRKYAENENFQQSVRDYSKCKYAKDEQFQQAVRDYSKCKYAKDEQFQQAVRDYSKCKYAKDEQFHQSVRDYSKCKYAKDEQFQQAVRDYSKCKYAKDEQFHQSVRDYSKCKYAKDEQFQQSVRDYSKCKYAKDEQFQQSVRHYRKTQYSNVKSKKADIDFVISQFQNDINTGPEHVCCVCHRLLFRKQVIECKTSVYADHGGDIASVADKCITYTYFHNCKRSHCICGERAESKLWICYTCHRKILQGKMPEESVANNLHLDPIPPELSCLNSLEQHLIARHIAFMKVLPLPKGGQHGVHGPVVCVPSDMNKISNILPRNDCDDLMIKMKLKRKLTYKGHYEYQYVQTEQVKNALEYLMKHNKWYSDVSLNIEWINPIGKTNEGESIKEERNVADDADDRLSENEETEENLVYTEDRSGLFLDSCLQPVDIAQEVLDQHFDSIFSIAPAEGNNPVRLLSDTTNEAKCFPVLYPTGGPIFHDERPKTLSISRYLNTRILNADGRFAHNTDFIFYAQYLSEVHQVVSNVSIAMRKGTDESVHVRQGMLTDLTALKQMFNSDEGYKFMRPIRGTPPFWQSAQKDLFAILRQLGIPTWFCSFSSADLRWPEMLSTMIKQERKNVQIDKLDWSQKCAILQRNPVTAARMFDHRWHCFLKNVLMSPASPIGHIKDYFYRVEFQLRGSPHVHCLFWVENAPQIDKDPDAEVVKFIDQYVTCEMPPPGDTELYETVNTVQKHSTRHSKTCKKNKTVCRFNFPRPPSNRTFITRPRNSKEFKGKEKNDAQNNDALPYASYDNEKMDKDIAVGCLEKIKSELRKPDLTYNSTDEFFASLGITQAFFEKANARLTKKTSIILRRQPNHTWVNQYNKDLIRSWNANMDIQFVVDAYSCVVYIISYISKAEKEMGLLLERADKEAKNGNVDAKECFKRLGSVYLHNREVCAQEAVYRLTNMHLKECSRKVQFIPTGLNPVKMSLPVSVLQNRVQNDGDDRNIWMISLVDRYKNRPITEELEHLCLAQFCSEYRVLAKSEVKRQKKNNDEVIELRNDMGFVKKRTRTDAAVVRYVRLSPTKDPEKYYHCILQLFLPYFYDNDLKPVQFQSFEDFYNTGEVMCNDNVQTVKHIVDTNRSYFEKDADKIDEAREFLGDNAELDDAWAQICPEAEKDRLECAEVKQKPDLNESQSDDNIPDLCPQLEIPYTVSPLHTDRSEMLNNLRTLNEEQSQIFYKIRSWCLEKVFGNNPDPLHVFITGGAGTGKSHLIKAIYYESTRILSHITESPDELTVVLTAPTGVAAYSIGATTIHNTLSIGSDVRLPYQPLGEDKINTLRSKLSNIQILIIDEISMVDHKLLAYIHGRLRQIKQTGDHSLFGKVSIIAVGDFYQLPPVKGSALYSAPKGTDVWDGQFSVSELTRVVRQKEKEFAEMLNRLRKHQKGKKLCTNDLQMLMQCETGENPPVLHIYATNAEVDKYNMEMLHSTCADAVTIEAQDFDRNPKTGRMEQKRGHHSKVFNTCLNTFLSLATDARVMLVKNVDVSDGLVNGAFGTVVHITVDPNINTEDEHPFPSAVHVLFDNHRVGEKKRAQCKSAFGQNVTIIQPEEDHVTNSGGTRRQFPLKLAWACSIHKVQGLTIDKAVVSLKKVFAAGQAYVALSRVTDITGLIIQDFNQNVIYCNSKIEEAIAAMPKFIPDIVQVNHSQYTIVMHNIQSLSAHFLDLQANKLMMNADCICLTETWLQSTDAENQFQLGDFSFQHRPRSNCYDNSDEIFSTLKQQAHGGIAVYYKPQQDIAMIIGTVVNLEYMLIKILHLNLIIAVLYRPPSYKISTFKLKLQQLICEMDNYIEEKIIMGDFNENIFTCCGIQSMMEEHGYAQVVSNPTTERGTLIDHVYVKMHCPVNVEILPTYYSLHEAILVKIL